MMESDFTALLRPEITFFTASGELLYPYQNVKDYSVSWEKSVICAI